MKIPVKQNYDFSTRCLVSKSGFEYYEYNILGAYISENMPIFVEKCNMDEVEILTKES